MKQFNLLKRGSAAVLAAAMLAGALMPASAAAANSAEATKSETVYATLGSDGSVQSMTESVHLHADTGLKGYTADTGLSDVVVLKDSTGTEISGSVLEQTTNDTDVWYQGTPSGSMPVTADITYTLDGQSLSAEEIVGKSGHLVMTVNFTNNTAKQQLVNGSLRTVATPFIAAVVLTLDGDAFSNVKTVDALQASDAASNMVALVCMPGMSACCSDLLDNELSQLQDYLKDSVSVEADVTDFEMPMFYIAVSTSAKELANIDTLSDYSDLLDELSGLTDKLDEMMDGITQLQDGSVQLDDGASSLLDGAKQLDDGAATAKSGADKLKSGADTLVSGLDKLVSNNDSLNNGASSIANAILSTANTQLKAKGVITEDMTWSDYADVLSSILDVTDAMRAQAKAQIKAKVEAASGTTVTPAQLDAMIFMAAKIMEEKGGSSDFESALTAAAGQMQQAAADAASTGVIGAAQADLAAAGNNPLSVTSVAKVLQLMVAGGQAASAEEAYAAIAAQTGVSDASTNALLITMAANAIESSSDTLLAQVQAVPAAQSNYSAALHDAMSTAGAALTTYSTDPTQPTPPEIQTASAQLTAAGGDPKKIDSVSGVLQLMVAGGKAADTDAAYVVLVSQTGVSEASTAALLITMAANAIESSSDTLLAQLQTLQTAQADYTTALTNAMTSAGAAATNASNVQSVLSTVSDPNNEKYADAQESIKATLTSVVTANSSDDLAQVRALNTQLAQVQAFVVGLQTYTAGVASARDGAKQIDDGLGTLDSGLGTLKNGTASLLSGAQQLKDGTSQLRSGVQALYDGVDEAMGKLDGTDLDFDLDDIETLGEELKALQDAREDYTCFSGDAGSDESVVSFVMKVTADQDTIDALNPVEETTEVKTSWWQRLLALFNL